MTIRRLLPILFASGLMVVSSGKSSAQFEPGTTPKDQRFANLEALVPLEYGERTEKAAEIIADLANDDPALAMKGLHLLASKHAEAVAHAVKTDPRWEDWVDLRRTGTLDFVLMDGFEKIDTLPQRLQLLSLLLKDETLAPEIPFDFTILILSNQSLSPNDPPYDSLPREVAVNSTINDSVAQLCLSVPDDFPRLALVPSILLPLQFLSLAKTEPRWEPSERFPQIPDRFERLRDDINTLATFYHKTQAPSAKANLEPLFDAWSAELKNDAYPITARIKLAALATGHCRWETPPSARVQFANWIAEGWENDAVVEIFGEQRLLLSLLFTPGSDARDLAIRRLFSAWKKREARVKTALGDQYAGHDRWEDRKSMAYLIALSTEIGDPAMRDWLMARFPDSGGELRNQPLFPLLVREGEIDLAHDLLARRKQDLLEIGWGAGDAFFDSQLEKNAPLFLQSLKNPEFRYLTEIRLSLLSDLPDTKLNSTRAERIRTLSRQFESVAFQTAKAKGVALRNLATDDEAAKLLSQSFLDFAQLDRIPQHHEFLNLNRWDEFADATVDVLLRTNRQDDALDLFRKLNQVTERGNSRYQDTWTTLAGTLSRYLYSHANIEPKEQALLVPILEFLLSRPCDFYEPDQSNSVRGRLMSELFRIRFADETLPDWRTWHATLESSLRRTLDDFHLQTVVTFTAKSAPGSAEFQPYLKLSKVINETSRNLPPAEKWATIRENLDDSVPHAVRVLKYFHYFTPRELVERGTDIAGALGGPEEAWNSLADIARELEDLEKSKEFRQQARAAKGYQD